MADKPAVRLNPRHEQFVAEMLRNGGNASGAYRAVYGANSSTAQAISAKAGKLRKHPGIAAALGGAHIVAADAVAKAVARYAITADRVADELARLAFTRIDQLATVAMELSQDGKRRLSVTVRPFAESDPDALAAIVEVKRTAGGEVSIKLADKRAALMDIARLKGWIADKPVDNRNLVVFKVER